jgi:tRNA1(Val) A37 N6-methylase TrmN6
MSKYSSITSMVLKIPRALRERGLIETLYRILYYTEGYLFDLHYKIDTFSQVDWETSGVDHYRREHASMYDSTLVVSLRKMFRSLKIGPGHILVDMGCGKGRVLLIASEFGFNEARGIEFSHLLCNIARNNYTVFRTKTKTSTKLTIIESDVLDYSIKDDEDVFYMYHPFDAFVLNQVLQNISESVHRVRRKVWIIYCNPVYEKLVEEKMSPVKITNLTFGKNNYRVYEVK